MSNTNILAEAQRMYGNRSPDHTALLARIAELEAANVKSYNAAAEFYQSWTRAEAECKTLEAREASLLTEQKRILDFTGGLDPVEWMESEREERARLEVALQECHTANAALLDDGNGIMWQSFFSKAMEERDAARAAAKAWKRSAKWHRTGHLDLADYIERYDRGDCRELTNAQHYREARYGR